MVFRQIIIVLVFQEILLFKEVNISSWTTRPLSIGIAILPYIICLEECRLYNFLKNKCRASFVSMLMVDMSTVDSTENIKEIHRFYLFILFFFYFSLRLWVILTMILWKLVKSITETCSL